ncbi:MAG: outer rane beta-barrel protein, partial [Sediminibacterium sp.]|nr:outer rane beta-barrel protein [Sediminibacterium sp.]
SIVRARDSMLIKFARTDLKGKFSINDLPADKYVLLTSFPNYADYTDTFTLSDRSTIELGIIPMITKAHLLQEVVVKQSVGAIKMKGDTTEYKADSFHVQANATVEELLKKLHGIQVDKNGQITAQGQKVQKVLVDGEEFFGDDPTLVTQNIRADMVDKVQVFDKKSEQAAFTGIDDGQKTKTINFKLKDDKKKGYFGKVDGGAGTRDYYNGQLMFNKFRQKEKISFYGIFSNTGKIGLNWQDQRSYGDNSTNIQFDDNGNGYMESSGRDELEGWGGNYNGQGYPKVQTGGVHYNNKWGDDKQSINGNYKILDLSVTGADRTSTQYILPDTLYYMNQQHTFNNRIIRNKGNAVYDVDFDTTSSLKFMVDAGSDHKISVNQYITSSLAEDSSVVNLGNRRLSTDGNLNSFNSSLLWRKKLKKKGRTISINAKENYNTNISTGFLYADNSFFKGTIPVGSEVNDQFKTTTAKLLALDAKATYTEPLSTAASLVFYYGITVNNSSSNRSSFNKSASGKYETLDTAFSNDYTFNIFTQKGGASFSFLKKKYRFVFGNTVGYTNFSQTDNRRGLTGKRDFVNWFPQANASYSFTSQRGLYLNYSGSTIQPSLQQIQPLRTNDDPSNIVIGNASLQPSFRNSINLNYNDFKALSGRSIFLGTSYSSVANAFATKDYIDTFGRRISQAINVNGNYNLNGYIDYGFKLFGANLGINGNMNNARFVNIVNNQENVTLSQSYRVGLYAGRQIDKFYDNSISANVTYTTGQSSIQKDLSTRYWTYNIRPDLDFFFPWKLQIHADCDFIFRQKTSVFDENNNVVLLNAWFGKKLLAGDAMVIKISGNDILNQNIGFSRTVNTNYIMQNTYS